MFRIDAHQHFWKYDPVRYPWISDAMSSIRRDFLPSDLRQEMTAASVDGSIAVQAQQTVEETRWLLQLSDRHDFILGVVGWVPFVEPAISDAIAELASDPKLRGLRHVIHDEPDPYYILREDFNAGIRAMKGTGLAYDILIFERHLPQTIQFVDRHPNQIFVVDHVAKPLVRAGIFSPWQENLRELAKRPNVYVKLSGLATEGEYSNWAEDQLRRYLEIVLSTFGAHRLMFGSDWPVCLAAIEYRRWVSVIESTIQQLSASEQERIWSATAIEAYGLKRLQR